MSFSNCMNNFIYGASCLFVQYIKVLYTVLYLYSYCIHVIAVIDVDHVLMQVMLVSFVVPVSHRRYSCLEYCFTPTGCVLI